MGATTEMPSVLLIEDEALISLDLCEILVEAGYAVLGPAHTLAGALFLLQQGTPQLAIVDIHLRDGPCTEVANQLRERGVPFLVHSGYGRHSAEMSGFSGAPWLEKPALPNDIVTLLGQLSNATNTKSVSSAYTAASDDITFSCHHS